MDNVCHGQEGYEEELFYIYMSLCVATRLITIFTNSPWVFFVFKLWRQYSCIRIVRFRTSV